MPRAAWPVHLYPAHVTPLLTMNLRDALFTEAHRLGFVSVGIASPHPFLVARDHALDAIDAGRMSGMEWFTKERIESASDLPKRYPWARSIIALAWPYAPAPSDNPHKTCGRMSAYTCLTEDEGVRDYHDLLAEKCDGLAGWLRSQSPEVRAKRFVDHGWAMDRAIAERAGIGFIGKNTCLITLEAGSYVLLASMVVSLDLPPTSPSSKNCGSCQTCIPACPTGAIIEPGVIDATRCISYLTIEHRGPIPLPLRPLIGDWVFGCDLCQQACPINSRLAAPALAAGARNTQTGPVPFPDLIECLQLDEVEFAARFRATAVWRAGRKGLARNCAIALGNSGSIEALPALQNAASHDPDDTVREAAQWAMGQLTGALRVKAPAALN